MRTLGRLFVEAVVILAVCAGLYALAELIVWGRVR